jgi:hypothetical protein
LLRDCTTGIEAHNTVADMTLTRAAILEVEMLLGFTTTSDSLIAGVRALHEEPPAEIASTTGGSALAPRHAHGSFERFAERLGAKM